MCGNGGGTSSAAPRAGLKVLSHNGVGARYQGDDNLIAEAHHAGLLAFQSVRVTALNSVAAALQDAKSPSVRTPAASECSCGKGGCGAILWDAESIEILYGHGERGFDVEVESLAKRLSARGTDELLFELFRERTAAFLVRPIALPGPFVLVNVHFPQDVVPRVGQQESATTKILKAHNTSIACQRQLLLRFLQTFYEGLERLPVLAIGEFQGADPAELVDENAWTLLRAEDGEEGSYALASPGFSGTTGIDVGGASAKLIDCHPHPLRALLLELPYLSDFWGSGSQQKETDNSEAK